MFWHHVNNEEAQCKTTEPLDQDHNNKSLKKWHWKLLKLLHEIDERGWVKSWECWQWMCVCARARVSAWERERAVNLREGENCEDIET
jgi:hypothetical protein